MGVPNILAREHELLDIVWKYLDPIDNLHILADGFKDRLGVISFYIDDLHFNLAVKLLNDRYGIQTRGGCSCAGTYGHYLLKVSYEKSQEITSSISCGDLTEKPGWVRMSIHPTMTDDEVEYIMKAIVELAAHHQEWSKDYVYCKSSNEFTHHSGKCIENELVQDWFDIELA